MAQYKDVIGIIGGMGSYSTLYFFGRVLDSFVVDEEDERPRIIIDNYCTLPNKIKAYLFNQDKEELIQKIIESIAGLIKMGCTKIIIACNVTHIFLPEILRRHNEFINYVVDMIEILAKKIIEDNVAEVLVLTTRNTIATEVFNLYFEKQNIQVIYDIDHNEKLITELMASAEHNSIDKSLVNKFIALQEEYASRFIPIVLGCTELSMVYGSSEKNNNINIYDPIEYVIEYLQGNLR